MGLKKFAKKALRGAIKLAGGVASGATGGLAGAAISAFTGGRGGGGGGSGGTPAYNPPGIQLPGGFTLDLPFSGRPGMGLVQTGPRKGRVARGPNGECPKGYHLNKSPSADGQPARSFCVRNRRVNFANGRAARRAGRRLKGTVRQLRKSFSLVAAKAPKGKWIPKGRGKR